MTEAEWLACDQPELMFHDQNIERSPLSIRRRRLIGVAMCRTLPAGLIEPGVLEQWLATAERFAEQPSVGISPTDFVGWNDVLVGKRDTPSYDAQQALRQFAKGIINMTIFYATCARDPSTHARAFAMNSFLSELVRDIIGNPFRPIQLATECRTDTVLALARHMYESHNFSPMPILADALQDADCDNADILNHCRSDGPHVRGCWVVDLILGKE
jgi:hypothetical protein